MKTFVTAVVVMAFASSAMAQNASTMKNVPTGIDVKGCTYYKIVNNKTVCSPVWKEGYKQSLSNAASGGE